MVTKFLNNGFTASSTGFSKADALYVLRAKVILVKFVKQIKKVKNTFLVVFVAVDGKNAARFVSCSDLLQAKINRRIKDSKSVEFDYVSSDSSEDHDLTIADTTTGHTLVVDYNLHKVNCNCTDYLKQSISVSNVVICKHTISVSREILNFHSISQLINWIQPYQIAA